ncbi:uncharacterized protein LOC113332901 [Papaver somniferum]|uniref:uncharacterized protein LOC113332901 n=1 Tax=Papaver somniferum TaxID=3469 RepID=UPI000E7042A1|nr:uncharacterized protein LOC113332901 [Papaver somniferum]
MSKPKRCGGLGFKDSKKYNLTMLTKLAWRMVTNPKEKWAQLLKALYFPNKDPLVDDISKSYSSWVWKSIQHGLKIVRQYYIWEIGDGRSAKDVLPVNKKLGTYIRDVNSTCPMCNKEEETSSHLLLNCEFAYVVWFGMSSALHHSKNNSKSLQQWIKSWFSNSNSLEATNPDLANTAACTLWQLWKFICDRVFQNKIYHPREVIQKIRSYIKDNITTRGTIRTITVRKKENWQRPPKHWIKINIDASMIYDFSKDGFALIIRDCTGGFLWATAFSKVARDVMQVEAMILLKALQWIKDRNLQRVIVEGDNVSVINGCNGNLVGIPWEDHSLILECQQILSDLSQCVVSCERRGRNHAADLLEKHARRSIRVQSWWESPPDIIREILNKEANISSPSSV